MAQDDPSPARDQPAGSTAGSDDAGIAADDGKAAAWTPAGRGRLSLRSLLRESMPANDIARAGAVRPRLGVTLSRIGVTATSLLLIAVAALFAFRIIYTDRIYPAVVVGDVPVGGLTVPQAQAKVVDRAADFEGGLITFAYGGRSWSPTFTDLGATIDVTQSVEDAARLGRDGDTTSRLTFAGDLMREDQRVPLRTTIDLAVLDVWFDHVDDEIDRHAVDAGIVIVDGAPSITPDATGIVVDRAAATTQIVASLQRLEPVQLALPTTTEYPAVSAGDLEPFQGQIRAALAKPIAITFEQRRWEVDPADLVEFITADTRVVDGKPVVKLALDVDPLASWLNQRFAPEVNRSPVDAKLGWSDDDGLVAVEPAQDGATLKPKTFAENLSANFLGGKTIPIPVVTTRPEIDDSNLDALGITTRLGRGDSNFSGGDENRDTNIYIGVELANGTLVPPGADYSFNGAVGPITEDKGYVVSNVIFGETPGVDIGGGICQVSTTVYRAALMGGFPIAELHPHTYRILNYEYDDWGPGFDASILQLGDDPAAWSDLRFTNDTGGWLLVETWASYPHVVVSIYGRPVDRSVEITGITTGTSEEGGLIAGFTRVVRDGRGEILSEEEYSTTFK